MSEYKTKEVAEMFGVDRSTVTRWARNGIIEGRKIEKPVREGGDQYLFPKSEVIKLLRKKKDEYLDKYEKYRFLFCKVQDSLVDLILKEEK